MRRAISFAAAALALAACASRPPPTPTPVEVPFSLAPTHFGAIPGWAEADMAPALQLVPAEVAAIAMIPAHALIHVGISSTSGQAMLTMPIFAPLGDLLGISRDAVVLAFSAGGVFTDAVNPTNGGLLAMLLNAKVSYGRWLKFAIPGMLLVWAVAAVGIVLLG